MERLTLLQNDLPGVKRLRIFAKQRFFSRPPVSFVRWRLKRLRKVSPCLTKRSVQWKRLANSMASHIGRNSITTQLKNGGFRVKVVSWTGAELKKIMDSSDNCFIAADKGDMVDVDPDQGHVCLHEGRRQVDPFRVLGAMTADHCLSQGRAREGYARHVGPVAQTQGQKTCWDACESAVLDVRWRGSAGPLLGAHCGFWHEAWSSAGCSYQKLTPPKILEAGGCHMVPKVDRRAVTNCLDRWTFFQIAITMVMAHGNGSFHKVSHIISSPNAYGQFPQSSVTEASSLVNSVR